MPRKRSTRPPSPSRRGPAWWPKRSREERPPSPRRPRRRDPPLEHGSPQRHSQNWENQPNRLRLEERQNYPNIAGRSRQQRICPRYEQPRWKNVMLRSDSPCQYTSFGSLPGYKVFFPLFYFRTSPTAPPPRLLGPLAADLTSPAPPHPLWTPPGHLPAWGGRAWGPLFGTL